MTLVFDVLDCSISEPNGSVTVFIIGADNHHAVSSAMTTKLLVHISKYIQGHDHLSLEETAVDVLFGSSFIWDWMESFELDSEFQWWLKKFFL